VSIHTSLELFLKHKQAGKIIACN